MVTSYHRFLVLIFLLLTGLIQQVFSQSDVTYHFRSKLSGNWTTVASWESSPDNIVWSTANSYPTNLSSSITILNGNAITVNQYGLIADQMEIAAGGELIVKCTLGIADGDGYDLTCYGKITANDNLYGAEMATIRILGEYVVNLDATQSIGSCIWEDGSTLKLIAISNKAPQVSCLSQSFYNFEWNSPAQSCDITLNLPEIMTIRGKMSVISNLKKVIIAGGTSPRTINLSGDLELQSNGQLLLSSETNPITFNIGGNLIIYSLAKLYLGLATTSNHNIINLSKNLTLQSSNSYINRNLTGENYGNGTLSFVNSSVTHEVIKTGSIFNVNYLLNPGVQVNFNNLMVDAGHTLTIGDNASIITNSSVTASIERNLSDADWSVPLDGWHLLSSPVMNQSVATGGFTYPVGTPEYAQYDFFSWSESNNLWLNQKVDDNGINSLDQGVGYFVAYDNGGIKTFNGNLNVSDINLNNLSLTGSSPYAGFHLLGNPFQSGLDWENSGWSRTNVSEVAFIWNEVAMNYLPVTSLNGIIPPNQGFFIQVTDAVNSLVIPSSGRTHSNNQFNKNVSSNALHFRVTGEESPAFDETIIRMTDNASLTYDLQDGHKLAGSENAPQLFTRISPDELLSVNTFPLNGMPSIVPLYFNRGSDDHYQLKILLNNMDSAIWLEDLKTKVLIELNDSTDYSFESDLNDNENRFLLHFGTLGIPNPHEEFFDIYSFRKNIYVRNLGPTTFNGFVQVLSLTGQILYDGEANGDGLFSIYLPDLSPGIYLVHAFNNNLQITKKVMIM